jgi:hypothetical protein
LTGFKLEGLRELRLHMPDLSPDVVAALGRAAGLTQLRLAYHRRGDGLGAEEVGLALSRMSQLRELYLKADEVGHEVGFALPGMSQLRGLCLMADEVGEEVGLALSRMSQLRALSLEISGMPTVSCVKAIGLLTELTEFEWKGKYVTNADLQGWLGLKKVRGMRILPKYPAASDRITR